MEIDQINIRGVDLLEAEDDPPVGAHGDAPISGEVASERMQPKSRQVELSGRVAMSSRASMRAICPRAAGSPRGGRLFIKASEAAMAKSPDHGELLKLSDNGRHPS
jgi:hypothetical protein